MVLVVSGFHFDSAIDFNHLGAWGKGEARAPYDLGVATTIQRSRPNVLIESVFIRHFTQRRKTSLIRDASVRRSLHPIVIFKIKYFEIVGFV